MPCTKVHVPKSLEQNIEEAKRKGEHGRREKQRERERTKNQNKKEREVDCEPCRNLTAIPKC